MEAIEDMRRSLPTAPKTTVKELYEEYLSSSDFARISASQRQKMGYAWNHVQKLGEKHIAELTYDEMQALIDEECPTYYPARDVKVLLSHIYQQALKRDLVPRNRSELLDLPELSAQERKIFSELDIARLWMAAEAGEDMPAMIIVLIYTGARPGELIGMRRENIHLQERYMVGGSKTAAGRNREYAIPERVLPLIARRLKSYPGALPWDYDDTAFYADYYAAIERCNCQRLSPYSCRHTFVTMALSSGADALLVANMVGHASTKMTNHYNHTQLPKKLEIANALPFSDTTKVE